MTITSLASDSNHYDPQISEYTSDGGLMQCTELQTELPSKDGGTALHSVVPRTSSTQYTLTTSCNRDKKVVLCLESIGPQAGS